MHGRIARIDLAVLVFWICAVLQGQALAQDMGDAAAQANNPLANFTAFNIHDYYIGERTDSDDTANQAWLRFAKPFSIGGGSWLMRASLPINSFPVAPDGDRETGVGDLNVFAAYLIDIGNPAISFGIGPQLTAPTAGKDELGSGKWSAGLANVLFDARSQKYQYGYLLTWQASFAGDDDRDKVNVAAFQPFGIYQLGGGTYLRSTGVWAFDLENDRYSIPVGLGVGQVFKKGSSVYNLFLEPQYSVSDKGSGQPKWQIFLGINLQFIG